MKKQKYAAWIWYMQDFPENTCTLTFDEIEAILGFPLPNVAADHAQVFWSNGNQHYALIWLRAGWVVSQYDTRKRFVVFRRDEAGANSFLAKCRTNTGEHPQNAPIYRPQRRAPRISCGDLIGRARKYYDDLCRDEHARYLSWEQCYAFVQKNRLAPTAEQRDLMCLHLAWYLASWGMLRGGAFVLRKDYLVHMPVVELLVSAEYGDLYGLPAGSFADRAVISRICRLADAIREAYRLVTSADATGGGETASDTLVTKILLGTTGAAPAYDRYFRQGLSLYGVAQQRFGAGSMLQLGCFYMEHFDEFETFRKEISRGRVEYTPMKIMDMCFWQLGYDGDAKKEPQSEADFID